MAIPFRYLLGDAEINTKYTELVGVVQILSTRPLGGQCLCGFTDYDCEFCRV